MIKKRHIFDLIKRRQTQKSGRLIILVGARQTGKTTLVKNFSKKYSYISLEDPVGRADYTKLTKSQWYTQFPQAILDEVQKSPQLIESVKALYDSYDDCKYLLLGSSQITMLKQVKESLAGRVSIYELYPLTLPELHTTRWSDKITPSKMIQWITDDCKYQEIWHGTPLLDDHYNHSKLLFEEAQHKGTMPVMVDPDYTEEEKEDWLDNYTFTYLQRDLADMTILNDLEPFVTTQKALALQSGQLLNYSSLAKIPRVSPNTIKRYLHYLGLSYQVFKLPAWAKNESKRLSKAPKVHFVDTGVMRSLTRRRGPLNGHEFETTVVSEIYKQIKTWQIKADLYHLRTVHGREIDLLIELEQGYIPIEIKQSANIRPSDARHLKGIGEILDKPVIHSFLLSNDQDIHTITPEITALPIPWFLG